MSLNWGFPSQAFICYLCFTFPVMLILSFLKKTEWVRDNKRQVIIPFWAILDSSIALGAHCWSSYLHLCTLPNKCSMQFSVSGMCLVWHNPTNPHINIYINILKRRALVWLQCSTILHCWSDLEKKSLLECSSLHVAQVSRGYNSTL